LPLSAANSLGGTGWRRRPGRLRDRLPDGHAAYPREHPVPIQDLAATIYHALSVNPRAQFQDIQGQLRNICDGDPVVELF